LNPPVIDQKEKIDIDIDIQEPSESNQNQKVFKDDTIVFANNNIETSDTRVGIRNGTVTISNG
jgi:hypothetical protein